MKKIKSVLVVLVAISFLASTQYDLFTIERAVWTTAAFSTISLAGIILIFKPEKPLSRVLGVLLVFSSIINIVTVWRTFY
ncbi:hypothetical protein [Dethiobacter alkaliphilus]|uniref:hypothetical protein n=1 Tax=Dethiobacter alkaliphilus TaxID=427926 RepID=UPI002227CA5B|nr:hypothetical protein [Dethiobacter alkaliphilus]MCW3491692.1 hypothetical protein [Dethiobacter alkaliphilus]